MMNAFLLKRLAVALTASQIFTHPDAIQTQFDPGADKQVQQLLQDGCGLMTSILSADFPDFEKLDIDQLLGMLIDNAKQSGQNTAVIGGLNLTELKAAYLVVCKGESVENSPIHFDELIAYYNNALKDLPDPQKLKTLKLSEASVVLDTGGQRFTETFKEGGRRKWMPLSQIPTLVQKAFIAAEDKRFFEHKGVDERGLIRAAVHNATAGKSRDEGGSTITQQIVKNLLVGHEETFERKMREMVVATRLEKIMSKNEILELYLNYVFLGRASWGVEMAAQSYFGKSVAALTIAEAAFLAGMPKGPRLYDPDRNAERSAGRTGYVLAQMKEDGFITAEQYASAATEAKQPRRIAFRSPRARGGFYFVDELIRAARNQAGVDPKESSLTIKSTIQPELQSATEAAVQEGLAQYELAFGRAVFSGPEKNLTAEMAKIEKLIEKTGDKSSPVWQQALRQTQLPLYDVHWWPGVVVQNSKGAVKVGLKDGRVLPLHAWKASITQNLKLNDVVWLQIRISNKNPATAELRFRPRVQGAAIIVDNATGGILAMVGGFSYPLSQLNRVVHMIRQPGSTVKPLTYLAALQAGYQPNTMVMDQPIELSPIERGGKTWSPSDYVKGDNTSVTTMEMGLENSLNRVTAGLLNSIASTAPESLDKVRALMQECGIPVPERVYPIVIGGFEVSVLNMATCFATIAKGGIRPQLHLIDSIEKDGHAIFQLPATGGTVIRGADAASFFQLRTMLQGVLSRGTAKKIGDDLAALVGSNGQLSDYVALKTGTSQQAKDAWLIGFTNDVTIATWVGYDNPAAAKTYSLGEKATGATVAVRIFEPLLRAVTKVFPLRPFPPPTGVVARQLVRVAVQQYDGRPVSVPSGSGLPDGVIVDYFRLDSNGQPRDTWQSIVQYDSSLPVYSQTVDTDAQEQWNNPYQQLQQQQQWQPYPNYNPRRGGW